MRKFGILVLTIAICWFAAYAAEAAELSGPSQVAANAGLNLLFSGGGSGDATFYLFGPSHVSKRTAKIGEPIAILPEEVRSAGRYVAVLRSGDGVASKATIARACRQARRNQRCGFRLRRLQEFGARAYACEI